MGDPYSLLRPLEFSVPHTSYASLLLYSVYAGRLKHSISNNVEIHGFVVDHALKDSFKPAVDVMDRIIDLEECLWDVKIWMGSNRLKMSDAKTEFLLCGSRQQMLKCITSSLMVYDTTVEISQVIKYLGIWDDINVPFKY